MKRLDIRATRFQQLLLLEAGLWAMTLLGYALYRPSFLFRVLLYAVVFFLLLHQSRKGLRPFRVMLVGLCLLFGAVGLVLLVRSCSFMLRFGRLTQLPMLLIGLCWLAQPLCAFGLWLEDRPFKFPDFGLLSKRQKGSRSTPGSF